MRTLALLWPHWFWDPTAPWYVFWSGFGSCLTELGILGIVLRRINCGVKGCWRVGLRKVPGTDHVVCHRHHPHDRLTHAQVLDDHRRATGQAA